MDGIVCTGELSTSKECPVCNPRLWLQKESCIRSSDGRFVGGQRAASLMNDDVVFDYKVVYTHGGHLLSASNMEFHIPAALVNVG